MSSGIDWGHFFNLVVDDPTLGNFNGVKAHRAQKKHRKAIKRAKRKGAVLGVVAACNKEVKRMIDES